MLGVHRSSLDQKWLLQGYTTQPLVACIGALQTGEVEERWTELPRRNPRFVRESTNTPFLILCL